MEQDTRDSLAANAVYVTAAFIFQKTVSFFFFLLIARQLGEGHTGDYVAAFSYSTLFAFFIDLGLSQVLIREGSRDTSLAERLLAATLRFKIVLAGVTWLALVLFVAALQYGGFNHPPLAVVAVAGLIAIFDSFALTAFSFFRSRQSLRVEAIAIVLQKIGVVSVASVVLFTYPSTLGLAVAILMGSIFGYLWLFFRLRRASVRPLTFTRDPAAIIMLRSLLWPFAMAGFFSTAYAQLDSVLLSMIQGSAAVGVYSVAAKTMNAFGFIPAALVAALYPALSAAYLTNKARVVDITVVAIRYLFMTAVPISIGLYVLADVFVLRLGPGYAPAATAVRILIPSLPFMFLTFPIGALLNGANQASRQTKILGAGLLVNVLLNLITIPSLSYIGASISWSVSNVIMFGLSWYYARGIISLPGRRLALSAFRILLAGLCMAFVVVATSTQYPSLLLTIAAGAVTYSVAIFLLREFTLRDVRYFLLSIRS